MAKRKLAPVDLSSVTIDGPFWSQKSKVNRERTIPYQRRTYERMSRVDSPRMSWQWIETACYSLITHLEPRLESFIDKQVELIAGLQGPDGYIFRGTEPDKRWINLRDRHELYGVGHLIEAAVAYLEATGKRTLLEVAIRAADNVAGIFGNGPGQKPGYPGHEEIELALMKLYNATGEKRYADLSKYFLDERGKLPHYYDREAEERGEEPAQFCRAGLYPGGYPWSPRQTTPCWQLNAKQALEFARAPTDFAEPTMRIPDEKPYEYCQAHKPVRAQEEVVGHAVRGMYLYAAMADVAAEYDDSELQAACERLWESMTSKRMYITGGIGSSICNEGFTQDYQLPNETSYCETCAACALVFWAHRMLQINGDRRYADVMERVLYNGALVGVSMDGERFFYINRLTSLGDHHRQEWYKCACCPPNIARLLASLGGYAYSQSDTDAVVHLYIGGSATFNIAGRTVDLRISTRYPWEGNIEVTVSPEVQASFGVSLRVPAWCRDFTVNVNGHEVSSRKTQNGYLRIAREWKPGDRVELNLAMPVELIRANPNVIENRGHVALQRGPIVYCLEQADNDVPLHRVIIPAGVELRASFREDLLDGVVVIDGDAYAASESDWDTQLYRSVAEEVEPLRIRAVPYYAWDNREPGEMRVWIRGTT